MAANTSRDLPGSEESTFFLGYAGPIWPHLNNDGRYLPHQTQRRQGVFVRDYCIFNATEAEYQCTDDPGAILPEGAMDEDWLGLGRGTCSQMAEYAFEGLQLVVDRCSRS